MPVNVPLSHPRIKQVYETDAIADTSRAFHNAKPGRGRVVAPVERSAAWIAGTRKPGCVVSCRNVLIGSSISTFYFEIPIVPFTESVKIFFRAALSDGGVGAYRCDTDLETGTARSLVDTGGLGHDLAVSYQEILIAGDGDGADAGTLGAQFLIEATTGSARLYSLGWQLLPMIGEVQS